MAVTISSRKRSLDSSLVVVRAQDVHTDDVDHAATHLRLQTIQQRKGELDALLLQHEDEDHKCDGFQAELDQLAIEEDTIRESIITHIKTKKPKSESKTLSITSGHCNVDNVDNVDVTTLEECSIPQLIQRLQTLSRATTTILTTLDEDQKHQLYLAIHHHCRQLAQLFMKQQTENREAREKLSRMHQPKQVSRPAFLERFTNKQQELTLRDNQLLKWLKRVSTIEPLFQTRYVEPLTLKPLAIAQPCELRIPRSMFPLLVSSTTCATPPVSTLSSPATFSTSSILPTSSTLSAALPTLSASSTSVFLSSHHFEYSYDILNVILSAIVLEQFHCLEATQLKYFITHLATRDEPHLAKWMMHPLSFGDASIVLQHRISRPLHYWLPAVHTLVKDDDRVLMEFQSLRNERHMYSSSTLVVSASSGTSRSQQDVITQRLSALATLLLQDVQSLCQEYTSKRIHHLCKKNATVVKDADTDCIQSQMYLLVFPCFKVKHFIHTLRYSRPKKDGVETKNVSQEPEEEKEEVDELLHLQLNDSETMSIVYRHVPALMRYVVIESNQRSIFQRARKESKAKKKKIATRVPVKEGKS